jgi:hypothetical protein
MLAENVMAIMFWDLKRILLVNYMPHITIEGGGVPILLCLGIWSQSMKNKGLWHRVVLLL